MKSITRWPIDEINRLHGEVVKAAKTTLEKAIHIGERLDNIKSTLPHGSWLPWVRENLHFTDRTARNYMRLYEHRAQLENGNVSDLAEAYATLTASKPVDRHRLDALEIMIGGGLKDLEQLPPAIAEIRDKRLYRGSFKSFAEYCEARLGLSESDINELLSLAGHASAWSGETLIPKTLK